MIKITSGIHKNKSLETISKFVRPTSSLKREAFFSIIESYSTKKSLSPKKGKVFLDLFAGIGTMGLEAISRGYEKAVFVENNNEVIKILKKNCKNLCFNNQYTIIEQDVFNVTKDLDYDNYSVIYIDPPYFMYEIDTLLSNIQDKINKDTLVVVETSIKDNYTKPSKLKIINKKKYGKTDLSFFVLS